MSSAQSAEVQPDPREEPDDSLLECLAILTRLHGRPVSPDALAAGLPLEGHRLTPALFVRAAELQGYSARVLKRGLRRISNLVLPAVLLLKDGRACVATQIGTESSEIILPESGIGAKSASLADLAGRYTGYCIFVQPRPRADRRSADIAPVSGRWWFWGTLWRFRSYYVETLVAAAMINLLALATSLFVMNVYDRVVPNNAEATLWVLAAGVAIAVGFEFVARTLRGYLLDVAGRKVDLLLASQLFRQALGMRMEARPASAGAFAANVREFESLRDFFTSATLTTLTDLPFVFLFTWIISLIGGPIALVPMLAIPLLLLAGLVAQFPLARLMQRHLSEASARHGVLVEAVEGVETLKTLSAEGELQRRWENYTALTSRTALESRFISAFVVNLAILVQQAVTILLVVWGVYRIGAGELTVGGLIACTILAGRALAPLGQLAGLLTRYQHSRTALLALNRIMDLPTERPAERSFLHRPALKGQIEFAGVGFGYPRTKLAVLHGVSFRIEAGEHVALVGRVGSGKSTTLRLMMGLYESASGSVLVDGTDIQQIDPADLRRDFAYVSQDVRLFFGTLRENITLGAPLADEDSILAASRIAGLERMVANHPLGFDLPVGERAEGLSGGQKQSVALARALLANPRVYLLDEPTSSMDHNTEQAFIAEFRKVAAGRTLVLATHKPAMLALVDRLIVLDSGKVVADGPRDVILKALTQNA
ncbi:MAG: type I secretion system permease/ATPase [Burkholderiales bacterium]|nr:type I secretion system permease/ATPase [Burkholderiales bacterium]